jgi:hypothetical protein
MRILSKILRVVHILTLFPTAFSKTRVTGLKREGLSPISHQRKEGIIGFVRPLVKNFFSGVLIYISSKT